MSKKFLTFIIAPLVLFALFQSGCNVNRVPPTGDIIYDIRGVWTINRNAGFITHRIECTFTGTLTDGTVTPETGTPGPYDVGGETGVQVKFYFWSKEKDPNYFEDFIGKFIDANHMEGSGNGFVWSAVREVAY